MEDPEEGYGQSHIYLFLLGGTMKKISGVNWILVAALLLVALIILLAFVNLSEIDTKPSPLPTVGEVRRIVNPLS